LLDFFNRDVWPVVYEQGLPAGGQRRAEFVWLGAAGLASQRRPGAAQRHPVYAGLRHRGAGAHPAAAGCGRRNRGYFDGGIWGARAAVFGPAAPGAAPRRAGARGRAPAHAAGRLRAASPRPLRPARPVLLPVPAAGARRQPRRRGLRSPDG
nr:hypothetical protein [Tanacetum cinerariifolium]